MVGKGIPSTDFSGGLILDNDALNIKLHQSPYVSNADLRFKSLKKLAGPGQWKDSLPSGLSVRTVAEIEFSLPSTNQVTVVYGLNGVNNQLWVRPYVDLNGNWVDGWQELTEHEGGPDSGYLVTASGSTTTSYNFTGLAGETTSNYYKGWILHDVTTGESRIVNSSSYSSGTWTLSLNRAMNSSPSSNDCVLYRNNLYSLASSTGPTVDNFIFSPELYHVEIVPQRNGFIVLTGSDFRFGIKSDLWCGYIERSYLQDSNFTWRGIACERNSLSPLHLTNLEVSTSAVDDPVPDNSYVVYAVPEYDGFQEGPMNPGLEEENNFLVGKSYQNNITTVSQAINVELFVAFTRETPRVVDLMLLNTSAAGSYELDHVILSRRISGYRVYMAKATQVDTGSGRWQPSEDWRFVRRVDINDSGWSYDAVNKIYNLTFTINGRDYDNSADADLPTDVNLEGRQNHTDLFVYANAKTAAVAGGRVFVGNVYIDEKRHSWVIGTPNNSDGINTYSVMPWTSEAVDVSAYGVPEIVKMASVLNRIIVIGTHDLIRIDPNITGAGFSVGDHYQDRGGIAMNGVVSVGDKLFIAGTQGILAYVPQASNVIDVSRLVDITDGAIQDTWRGFSIANRVNCALGYDRRYDYLVISLADATFAFHLGRNNWIYYGNTQYVSFATGVDGELIGVTAAGGVEELFSDSQSSATQLIYQSPTISGPAVMTGIRMKYKSDVNITVKIFDLDVSSIYPLREVTFFPQSSMAKSEFVSVCEQGQLLSYRIESAASISTDVEIAEIEPHFSVTSEA